MSEPVVTSNSSNHSVPISKPDSNPNQDPHSVAHETVPPESRPVGNPEHGTTGPDDKPPGAPEGQDYPPQKHAGAVGLGPHYAEVHGNESGFGAKLTGMKEELKGKVTRNPDLAQKGHDRKTGELKAKEQAADDAKSPFGNANDDKGAEKDGNAAPPPNAPNAASAQQTAPKET